MFIVFLFQYFDCPIIFSDTGLEYINVNDYDTVFVMDKFEGDIFMRLHKAGCRIIGPPVVIKCAKNKMVSISAVILIIKSYKL